MTNNFRIHEKYDFFTSKECNTVKDLLLKHEKDVLSIPHAHKHNQYSGITNKLHVYNWLEHTELRNIFTPKLFSIPRFKSYDTLWVQCWGNILRFGEMIKKHYHREEYERNMQGNQNTIYACSVFISGNEKHGILIEDKHYTNKVGECVVLGEEVVHRVKTYYNKEPRISLAFDVIDKDWTGDRSCVHQPQRYVQLPNPYI